MKPNQFHIYLMVIIVLPSLLFSQGDSVSYYPLVKGDWREYSIFADGGMVQGLVREGVVDTVEIGGNTYSKQYRVNLISGESTFIRQDSSGNILLMNTNTLSEDTLCIFDWTLVSDYREWVVSSYPGIPDSVFGWLFPEYHTVEILPLDYTEYHAKKIQYRLGSALLWTELYAPGVGLAYYISGGYGKFLERIRLGDETFLGNYNIPTIDTLTFSSDQMEFTILPSQNRFEFDFSFNPGDYNWSSCTLGEIHFTVAPKSEIYTINTTLSGGGIYPSAMSIQSIALDSNKYVDCLDARYIGPIEVFSEPINISGRYRASMLPQSPADSTAISTQLMDVDSFEVSLVFTRVTVGVEDELEVVEDFIIRDVYPNPFNPSTTIEYELPEHSDVSLVIYDIAGREVNTLVSTTQQAGSYNVTWDGTDHNGLHVAGGMYFARLQAGEYSSVVKMVYLR